MANSLSRLVKRGIDRQRSPVQRSLYLGRGQRHCECRQYHHTFVAGQDDTAVTLTTVEHTNYDTGDFTISGLADYSYGDNIDIRIEPKDTRITDYIVRYVRNAGTSNEEEFNELPKDAGTYTLRIIQGDTVRIDIPEKITIHPVTITNDTFQNELAVTLPEALWKRKAMIIQPQ